MVALLVIIRAKNSAITKILKLFFSSKKRKTLVVCRATDVQNRMVTI